MNGRGYVARLPDLFARSLRPNAVGCGWMRRRLSPRVNGLGAKLLKRNGLHISFWSRYESGGQEFESLRARQFYLLAAIVRASNAKIPIATRTGRQADCTISSAGRLNDSIRPPMPGPTIEPTRPSATNSRRRSCAAWSRRSKRRAPPGRRSLRPDQRRSLSAWQGARRTAGRPRRCREWRPYGDRAAGEIADDGAEIGGKKRRGEARGRR